MGRPLETPLHSVHSRPLPKTLPPRRRHGACAAGPVDLHAYMGTLDTALPDESPPLTRSRSLTEAAPLAKQPA